MVDKECDFKFTLTITTEIDLTTYLPVSFAEDSLQFCVVEVRPENKFTYLQASQTDMFGNVFGNALKICDDTRSSSMI